MGNDYAKYRFPYIHDGKNTLPILSPPSLEEMGGQALTKLLSRAWAVTAYQGIHNDCPTDSVFELILLDC